MFASLIIKTKLGELTELSDSDTEIAEHKTNPLVLTWYVSKTPALLVD